MIPHDHHRCRLCRLRLLDAFWRRGISPSFSLESIRGTCVFDQHLMDWGANKTEVTHLA
jgi:hypothetical protein